MTKSIQPRTWKTALNETGKNYYIQKPKKEDNMSLYLSLLDDLNNLYKVLSKLNYFVLKKNLDQKPEE